MTASASEYDQPKVEVLLAKSKEEQGTESRDKEMRRSKVQNLGLLAKIPRPDSFAITPLAHPNQSQDSVFSLSCELQILSSFSLDRSEGKFSTNQLWQ